MRVPSGKTWIGIFGLMVGLTLLLTGSALAVEGNPDAVLGQWLTQDGDAGIEIYKCGKEYCGKIVWLKEPKRPDGKDKIDDKNPDVSKQNRPLMGMNLVWGFEFKGNNKWEEGGIYDPKEGKTYKCHMTLDGNKLNVRGYMGISLIGRTTTWTRK